MIGPFEDSVMEDAAVGHKWRFSLIQIKLCGLLKPSNPLVKDPESVGRTHKNNKRASPIIPFWDILAGKNRGVESTTYW